MVVNKKHTNTLEMDKLCCGYRTGKVEIPLINSFSGKLKPGELVCLVGNNGSGKSTLIKTLLSIIPPLSGSVYLNGGAIANYTSATKAVTIGAALTTQLSEQQITVSEFVSLGRYQYTNIFGKLRAKDWQVIEKSIRLVKLSDKKHAKFFQLSDGEKQKATIAKILAQETPLIILDEPMAHLDIPNKINVLKLLRELSAGHQKAILISTHDIGLAIEFADRLWLIDKQKNICTGMPEDMVFKKQVQAIFSNNQFQFNGYHSNIELLDNTRKKALVSASPELLGLTKKVLAKNNIGLTSGNSDENIFIKVSNNPLSIHFNHGDIRQKFPSFALLHQYLRELV